MKKFLSLFLIPLFVSAFEISFPPVHSFHQIPYDLWNLTKKNHFSEEIHIYWSNLFQERANFSCDFELLKIEFILKYGLAEETEVQLSFPFVWIGGGVLDPFIDGFHKTFGFPDAGRSKFPFFRTQLHLTHGETDPYSIDSPTGGVSSPHLFIRREFEINNKPIRLKFGFKVPLSNLPQGLDYKLPSMSVQMSLPFNLPAGKLWLSFATFLLSKPSFISREEFSLFTYKFNLFWFYKKIILSFATRTSPFKEENLRERSNVISLAVLLNKNFLIGVMEDISPYKTTPDISFFLLFKH